MKMSFLITANKVQTAPLRNRNKDKVNGRNSTLLVWMTSFWKESTEKLQISVLHERLDT